MRPALLLIILTACTTHVGASDSSIRQASIFATTPLFGTDTHIALLGKDSQHEAAVHQAIIAEAGKWEQALSTWKADSTLMTAIAAAPQVQGIDYEVLLFLQRYEQWMQRFPGILDPRLSFTGIKAGSPAWTTARAKTPWTLNLVTMQVGFQEQCTWSFDAIAKGFIIDKLIAFCKSQKDIRGGLIMIGGDGRCFGARATDGDTTWTLAVRDPKAADNSTALDTVMLSAGEAIATSGTYARKNHLLDPGTGQAVGHTLSATVIADTATAADALATALAVMPLDQAKQELHKLDSGGALLISQAGKRVYSPSWLDYREPTDTDAAEKAEPAQGPAWPQDFAVHIDLHVERGSPKAYVAAWVEDEEGRLVKLLAIWGKDGYDYTMKRWFRHAKRQVEAAKAVTEATRRHGHHRLRWDGKNQQGQAAGQGTFKICLEVNREDGKRDYRTVLLPCAKQPSSGSAKAGANIKNLQVRYGP